MRDSERKTLQFIEQFVDEHGYSPTLIQIARGIGITSRGSVSNYVDVLIEEGWLGKDPLKQRGLRLLKRLGSPRKWGALPLLGNIAAGKPIEAITESEELDLPALLGEGQHYVLRVRGDSMIEEGILDGDFVICKPSDTADNGDIVVALIDGEAATLKRFYQEAGGRIKLVPANSTMAPQVYDAGSVQIQGIFKGLFRGAP